MLVFIYNSCYLSVIPASIFIFFVRGGGRKLFLKMCSFILDGVSSFQRVVWNGGSSYERWKKVTIQERVDARTKTRIVNGEKAKLDEFPYQVLLVGSVSEYLQSHCGGTILDEHHVLTAAHCVHKLPSEIFYVLAGTGDASKMDPPAANYSVTHIIVHEDYEAFDGWKNDIAILKLSTPIEINDYVAPAKLPEPHEDVDVGESATVSDFGKLGVSSGLSPILYKTQVFIEDQKNFKQNKIRSTNLCTLHPSLITGFCRGDSGGPLTVDGKVVGVVSFSLDNACAVYLKKPQVYTRISEYIDWIYDNTNLIQKKILSSCWRSID